MQDIWRISPTRIKPGKITYTKGKEMGKAFCKKTGARGCVAYCVKGVRIFKTIVSNG